MSTAGPKFRVAICGGGIGGLTLAITIAKYDPTIPIDLYEAHESIDTIGAGITVWPQTHQVIVDLGLLDDFIHISENKPAGSGGGIHLRRGDIRDGGYAWFYKTRLSPSSMHRQHMVALLEKHLPASCTVHAKKRLVKYVEPEYPTSPIRLEFADGTIAMTDVLVGADGIRSAVRMSMFQQAAEHDGESEFEKYVHATATGMTVYRFLVPAEALRKESPENGTLKQFTAYAGKDRYLVIYPIAKGTLINVVGYVYSPNQIGKQIEGGHWMSEATRDEVIRSFDGFEPDVRAVMKLCDKPTKWALHVVRPLPFCVRKRVALVGDACHAMTPHLGAGGGQAMDDAYMLGRLIAHPLATFSRADEVLGVYQTIRLPFAQTVARFSLSIGWLFFFGAPGFYNGTRGDNDDDEDDRGVGTCEREGMEAIKQEVYKIWDLTDESRGVLQVWPDAEAKLRALAGLR